MVQTIEMTERRLCRKYPIKIYNLVCNLLPGYKQWVRSINCEKTTNGDWLVELHWDKAPNRYVQPTGWIRKFAVYNRPKLSHLGILYWFYLTSRKTD